ncbi:hypothetical protein PSY23_23630, partial [Shigella flexneri]|nr:hypothetical protein [Shigella flexneri]
MTLSRHTAPEHHKQGFTRKYWLLLMPFYFRKEPIFTGKALFMALAPERHKQSWTRKYWLLPEI